MSRMSKEQHEIDVAVRVRYIENQSVPESGHYVFAYTITITNSGTIPARLLTRHWLITDGNEQVQEVRGDGVVGQQPYLAPGEAFEYTSAAVIETPVGSMRGSYQMLGDDGVHFDAPIQAFSLRVPHTVH